MHFLDKIKVNRILIRKYLLVGMAFTFIYLLIEYYIKLGGEDPQALVPLLIRGLIAGALIPVSGVLFELALEHYFRKRTFIFLLLFRSIGYSLIITIWLSLINGIWEQISSEASFVEGMQIYLEGTTYVVNLFTIFLALLIGVSLVQIDSLHKRGELVNFLLGRFHQPREVNRIFCFIDLKDSTKTAEKLGHMRFASFLRDYYADIAPPINRSQAEIYQYIGDEVVLNWTYRQGMKDHRCLQCYFWICDAIAQRQAYYLNTYGVIPTFRAALHCGPVTVTWIGGRRKEIVYIGDILNTTKRLQDDCKRLGFDYLISGQVINQHQDLGDMEAKFVEQTQPRGKAEVIEIYALEQSAKAIAVKS